ncbi:methionine ABC transporter ATP-binding protein [Frisingicoccus sp.]|uniref:methionine ABC transporter ATP-binding protein n=1 Tax=Frisingicoccus sp. TaxID=1918627 RepID=UPI002E7642BE|nr:ATP-binding cassette domain-containing protein [Frisingicoccus sp.]MEE0751651.1 ATP-binding cassette domain-containing protein [Frisingicoccus sp.]
MEPMIKIEHLDKTFKGKTQTVYALKDINLDIQKGDIFGIIGMSGAGKSTLIRCMNFLERPTGGTVKIDGRDLAALSDKELRKIRQEVAMIFQHFNLLQQRNVRGNIAFSMEIAGMKKADIDARVDELLEIVDLKERALMYPAQLSGGQKQRVAIARALATNPKIILCDEATSALDPATTRSILALLKDINRKYGITIVIITHEMSVVESICSHVAIIDEGALVEAGTVEKVFTQPESKTAKRIIFQKDGNQEPFGRRCIRIVFDGKSSYEPVVANLIMECKIPVNIMFADTKDIDGKAYGHMVLQLPEDTLQVEKAIYYLRSKNLVVEELENYV